MTSEHPLQNNHKQFFKDLFFESNYSDHIGVFFYFFYVLITRRHWSLTAFFKKYVCDLYEALNGYKVVYLLKDGLPNTLT